MSPEDAPPPDLKSPWSWIAVSREYWTGKSVARGGDSQSPRPPSWLGERSIHARDRGAESPRPLNIGPENRSPGAETPFLAWEKVYARENLLRRPRCWSVGRGRCRWEGAEGLVVFRGRDGRIFVVHEGIAVVLAHCGAKREKLMLTA